VQEHVYLRLRMGLRIGVAVAIAVMAFALFFHWIVAGQYVGARERAYRAACMSNVKQFRLALAAYADEADGRFPWRKGEHNAADAWCDLGLLYPTYMIGQETFFCPSSRDQVFDLATLGPNRRHPEFVEFVPTDTERVISYAYCFRSRGPGSTPWTTDAPMSVRLIADKKAAVELTELAAHHGLGRMVLYADGHVEWIEDARALDPDEEDDNVGKPDAEDYADWWSDPPYCGE